MFAPLTSNAPDLNRRARVGQAPVPGEEAGFGGGVGAAFRMEAIETDWWNRRRSARQTELDSIREELEGRLGADEVARLTAAEPDRGPRVPATPADTRLLNLAEEYGLADVGSLQDRVNKRLRDEYDDAARTLEFMRGWRGGAEFLGRSGAAMSDPVSLALMPLGGGAGSLLRILGREALLGAAGEAAIIPRQYEVADQLGLPEPNPLGQIALGAAGGALFAGIPLAVTRSGRKFVANEAGRAYEWLRSRNEETPQIPGLDVVESARRVHETEKALRNDEPVPIGREPLLLEPYNVDPPPREPDNLVPDEFDIPPQRQMAINDLFGEAGELRRQARGRKPLVQALRGQIDPDTPAGQEIKARLGNVSRMAPGLMRRGAKNDLDVLPALEWEDEFPGIMEATRTQPGDLYLNRDGVIDLLVRDLDGDDTWLPSRAEARRLEAEAADLERPDGTAIEDYETFEPARRDSLYIDPAETDAQPHEQLSARVQVQIEDYLAFRGMDGALGPGEIAEIANDAARYGGEVRFLIERALQRNADELDAHYGQADPQTDGDARQAGQAEQEADGARGSGQAASDAQGGQRASERTGAGEQTLIDGVDPITDRDRLDAAMDRPMRGGNRAMDDGLFDTGARNQMDMFSEPVSDPVAEIDRQTLEDIRADLDEIEDFDIVLSGEGKDAVTVSARSVLNELDADAEFVEIAQLCGRPVVE